MPEKSKPAAEVPPVEEAQSSLMDSLRRVMLASIGAMALTRDELQAFIDKLIERGEVAEEEGKKLMNELMEKRKKKTDEAQEMAAQRVQEVLDQMNIPTRADINALGDKIASLSKKIDELKKTQS
jgi:poly(hydroxyalkanoate) granule-associated protein